MDVVCVDCGSVFDRVPGPGRPRVRCEACSPAQIRAKRRVKCVRCGVEVVANSSQKYCGRSCRDKDVWERQKAANPCPGCGGPMARPSTSSAATPRCRNCQRGGRDHGTTRMYDKGKCRCEACRKAKTDLAKKWRARRRAEGKPVVSKRRMLSSDCESCGIAFMARTDQAGRFCSMECAGNAHGAEVSRSRPNIPARIRKSVYARDGFACQLCSSPVRLDADVNHPRYPNLDHIVPYSKGGSDDEANLRLACRQCNLMRGANEGWMPDLVEVAS